MKTEIYPNFLIIGVPKSGSTSVYHHLRSHPDVYMPNTTELRYFNHKQVLQNTGSPDAPQVKDKLCKSWENYQQYFKDVSGETAIGECSTTYYYFKESLASIKQTLGLETKLILLLREPVSRAFSHYQYMIRRGKEKLSFEAAITASKERKQNKWDEGWIYTENSLYAERVQWLKESGFPFKVYLFEDFKRDPSTFMKDVFAYLGVDTSHELNQLNMQYNKGGVYQYKSLAQWMTTPSTFRKTLKRFLPTQLINQLRVKRESFIANQTKPLVLNENTKAELHEYFTNDVKALNQLVDNDLSSWGYAV